jgi:hypothetical protein
MDWEAIELAAGNGKNGNGKHKDPERNGKHSGGLFD